MDCSLRSAPGTSRESCWGPSKCKMTKISRWLLLFQVLCSVLCLHYGWWPPSDIEEPIHCFFMILITMKATRTQDLIGDLLFPKTWSLYEILKLHYNKGLSRPLEAAAVGLATTGFNVLLSQRSRKLHSFCVVTKPCFDQCTGSGLKPQQPADYDKPKIDVESKSRHMESDHPESPKPICYILYFWITLVGTESVSFAGFSLQIRVQRKELSRVVLFNFPWMLQLE